MNLDAEKVMVQFDPHILKCDHIASIITEMGYTAFVHEEMKHSSASAQPQFAVDHHSRAVIRVEGMVCINCAQIIESNLRKMKGIEQVSVKVEEKVANVVYNHDILTTKSICSAIEDLGFEATLPSLQHPNQALSRMTELQLPAYSHPGHNNELGHQGKQSPDLGEMLCVVHIDGMTCSSCVELIESHMRTMAAVLSIEVLLHMKEARIKYNPVLTSPKELAGVIDDLGYTVTEIDGILFILNLYHVC